MRVKYFLQYKLRKPNCLIFVTTDISKHCCFINARYIIQGIVLYCGRVPAANSPRCTATEGLLYQPWSLVIPSCTSRCLHQRP